MRHFFAAISFVLIASLAPASAAPGVPPPETGKLSLHEAGDVLTIQFGGRSGVIGIPSWKAVVRRDDAGNLSVLHVPANSPKPLSARTGQWPLAVIASANDAGIAGTMSRGRENFAVFHAEKFEVRERAAEKIVVFVGGLSKNKHYDHARTYTFTPAGVKLEGLVNARIDLNHVGLWAHWDRTQIAESHVARVPVRAQGREGWVYMQSSGQDGAKPFLYDVGAFTAALPLEIELRLRREQPTFLKVFLDRNFESADKRLLVHNDKDVRPDNAPPTFGKILSMVSGAVPQGTQQTYQVRYEFETREW